jgi:prepilin-type N-terminal cleavage/methylation domain-containing protein
MRGFTLIETVVVLGLVGLLAGVVGVTVASLRPPAEAGPVRALRAARAEAIRSGIAVRWRRSDRTVRFLPDGSSSGGVVEVDGKQFAIDVLTGEVRAID